MRTTTQISKITLCICGYCSVFQILVYMFNLVCLPVGLELRNSIGLADLFAHHRLIFASQFKHFGLYLRKIVLRNSITILWHNIIEETVFHCGTEAKLDARIKLLQRLGKQMGRRVPESVFSLCILKTKESDCRVLCNWPVKFGRLIIDCTTNNIAGQGWRYAFSNLQTGHTGFILSHRSVRKSNLYHMVY